MMFLLLVVVVLLYVPTRTVVVLISLASKHKGVVDLGFLGFHAPMLCCVPVPVCLAVIQIPSYVKAGSFKITSASTA